MPSDPLEKILDDMLVFPEEKELWMKVGLYFPTYKETNSYTSYVYDRSGKQHAVPAEVIRLLRKHFMDLRDKELKQESAGRPKVKVKNSDTSGLDYLERKRN